MSQTAENTDIFLSLAGQLFYVWCASGFLKRQLQGNVSEEGVFGGLLFCAYGILDVWFRIWKVPYILYAMLSHVILTGLAMAVFRGEREKKLFAGVILTAMSVLILNFSESFLCFIGLIFLGPATGGSRITLTGVWADRMIAAVTWVIWITSVNLLSKPLFSVFTDKSRHWYVWLSIPLSCMVLVTDLVNWAASNGIMVQDWQRYGVYENQLFSHCAMCIMTGLAMTASAALVFGLHKIDQEEKAREKYRSQVRYYEMLKDQYTRMEGLRHDMKNHMIALENLVHSRQWEKAGSYLKEMEEAGALEAGEDMTGSLVIDALLYHKRKQAKEHGIRWSCDANLPENCLVKETDLCIIVGNLVDNALEACLRLPDEKVDNESFIQIYIGKIKGCLLLEVRNSTDLSSWPEPRKSSKPSSGKHGLGLINVRSAAANYNGTVRMEAEKGVFAASVLLPIYEGSPPYN